MKQTLLTLTLALSSFVAMGQTKKLSYEQMKADTAHYWEKGSDDGLNWKIQLLPILDTIDCYFAIDPNNGNVRGEITPVWLYGYCVTKYEKPLMFLNQHKRKIKVPVVYYWLHNKID